MEIPDFDSIATHILTEICPPEPGEPETAVAWARTALIAQLRLLWNTRGAADLAQLEAEFQGQVDAVSLKDGTIVNLDRAIRNQDR